MTYELKRIILEEEWNRSQTFFFPPGFRDPERKAARSAPVRQRPQGAQEEGGGPGAHQGLPCREQKPEGPGPGGSLDQKALRRRQGLRPEGPSCRRHGY